ncbi:SDR family oxidoreductase [Microbacterium sp. zg.Y909]|uniref:SDR family oxidoreductase n=1 Tax=Microbacterium sp. zg.Y909 TaxID=2969413 RepID=UPI00214CE2B1|nr:SDR family oxidoreductase [Microbacterium sp. zg.Y909]MCR2824156.1 SDR family oxidoreductase [Microbacterium sp. zg.Y909]
MSEQITPVPGPGHALVRGRSVVITAAAGTGIGFAAAQRFAINGADLTISDRHERRLGEAADRLEAEFGVRPHTVPCDVTDPAQLDHLMDSAVERHGRIDVLVNNAGLGGTASVMEMTDDQWSSVLDVTLTSTFRATRSVLRHMLPQGSGVIINNASVIGWRAQAGQAHYAAAKAGVMALTRASAMDVAPHGIRINAVSPSIAMHAYLAKVSDDDLLAQLSAQEAFGRAAQPWEIANVMVFLASDYSSYMTGEVVSVSSQHA